MHGAGGIDGANGYHALAGRHVRSLIVPDHPGPWGLGRFDGGIEPRFLLVETQLYLRNGVGSAEGNAAELHVGPADILVMSRTVDAGKNMDRALVGPPFALPVALIVPVVHLNFRNPLDVLDPV